MRLTTERIWRGRRRRHFRRRRPGGDAAERQRGRSSAARSSSWLSGLSWSWRNDHIVAIGARAQLDGGAHRCGSAGRARKRHQPRLAKLGSGQSTPRSEKASRSIATGRSQRLVHGLGTACPALASSSTAGDPLGSKGGGEGGITPAAAAVINALAGALEGYSIDRIDMPATPLGTP